MLSSFHLVKFLFSMSIFSEVVKPLSITAVVCQDCSSLVFWDLVVHSFGPTTFD